MRFMNKKGRPAALIPLLALAASCNKIPGNSKPQWQIDYANDPRHFGIKDKLTYDAIQAITTVDTKEIPWADTYWPLVDRGSSFRAYDVSPYAREGGGQWPSTGLASFLAGNVSSYGDWQRASYLSPAEKHDLVLAQLNGVSPDLGMMRSEISSLARLEDGIDSAWSLSDKKAAAGQVAERLASSPLNSILPLATKGWITWMRNSANPIYQFGTEGEGLPWDWQGHCHGWAAASIFEATPKHSVMVRHGDLSLLFTEGDIRGLLTKAWADNPIQGATFFAGKRCELSVGNIRAALPADADGRVFGGEISSPLFGDKVHFHEIEETRRWNTPLGRMQSVLTLYVAENDETYYYVDPQSSTEKALLFTSFLKLNRYLNQGGDDLGTSAKVKFYGCRDSNPAAVHELLVKYLGQPNGPGGRPQRLVMDRAPGGQVWNQPLYRADFQVGELKKATDVPNDNRGHFRAAGTEYLAEVSTKLFWVSESDWPYAHFPEGFDENHSFVITINYTLEFDADKVLIGGEWGTIGSGNYTGWYPDFLWTYSNDAQPTDSTRINYSKVIKPIHDCSLAEGPLKQISFGGTTLDYTECPLDAAPSAEPTPVAAPTAEPIPIGPETTPSPDTPPSE